ncbi:aminotransferase class I/II-fold pyridoxal phosphate-dependent enzyme [Kaustia mangrovi]|uniref:Aminotransferase class I/II-fold pyridoxal phosphate-dependent enzyme n=1 Tax=Kaustia mangrovi TaxID=2593653 RepID=A0A7S8C642_9HYPH|nr:aminotransferase class I/II-fold pyridoxal phosphate-dependent enzyme [Kaustia mangrovi]QPC43894.1 aminotransferase class I/II-fold pyridoxal phosphate-dependent enzyme [Kaustia mangrovi]
METSDRALAMHFLCGDRDYDDDTALTPALSQSLNYRILGPDHYEEISAPMTPNFYARRGNPNSQRLARLLAAAEGVEEGMIFASGMAAISTTMMALLQAGDHVVAQTDHYIGTNEMTNTVLPSYGVESTVVDQTSVEAFERAIRPNTKLIMLETPANPLMTVTDLSAVAALARDRGILTFCDNTFATPINQRPASHGVDIVMHSISKYIGGHHDLLGGAVLSSREIMERIWDRSMVLGSAGAPFNSWLALRGLRTLELRIERHNANALALAEMLDTHSAVSRVFYPGLATHPQHELARRQMSGFGGLLTFELKGGLEAGRRFIERLTVPDNASSLGGVNSVVMQPAALFGNRLSEDDLRKQGIAPGMIRFATGIEPTGALLEDVGQALS